MARPYKIKYRTERQIFWRTIRGCAGDGVEMDDTGQGMFKWFKLDKGGMAIIPLTAEVRYGADRDRWIEADMAARSGQNIRRKQ